MWLIKVIKWWFYGFHVSEAKSQSFDFDKFCFQVYSSSGQPILFVVPRCHFHLQSSRLTIVPRFEPGEVPTPLYKKDQDGSTLQKLRIIILSHSLGIHMCMSYMYIGAQRIKYEIQFNTRDTPIPAGGLAHSTLQRGTALSWRAMYTYNIL